MKNQTTVTPAAPPIERRSPSRAPSTQSDASVPLRQAAISGALIGLSVAVLAGLVLLLFNERLTGRHLTFLVGLWVVVTTLVLTVLWFVQLSAAQRTIWSIERFTHLDLDGDAEQGEPLRWVPVNSVGAPRQQSNSDQAAQRFEAFITMAYENGKTDIRTARKNGFSDKEWEVFMGALETAQLVQRTRSGENAPRRLIAPNAHACIMTMRQRGLFVGGVS